MTARRRWTLTRHARERMTEMGVEEVEVYRVLVDPEVEYDQPRYGPTRRMAQRGDLAVAYDSRNGAVITVLWRRVEDWDRKDFRKDEEQ